MKVFGILKYHRKRQKEIKAKFNLINQAVAVRVMFEKIMMWKISLLRSKTKRVKSDRAQRFYE